MKKGRPQSVIFTAAEGRKLAGLYLTSNRDREGGSATMAARVMSASHEPLACALDKRASKHSLPSAVWEAVAPAKRLVGLHRQGERGLRNATYTPGLLRLSEDRTRRLRALERVSWDDGTMNFGVCIPWPWGGCKCSEKFGVKLGRFQLLLPHDDATSYIPAWNFVVRPEQSYRGTDAAGGMLRFARDVGRADTYMIEGGVWQGVRVMSALDALAIRWLDAKGRPECKLVENFFSRMWTRLSIELPFAQVGRFREDDKRGQKLYCDCRLGSVDPRKHYPMIEPAMAAVETTLRWLNTEPVESREYGTWIPLQRWIADLAEFPHERADADALWLAAPVLEERVVRKGMVTVTANGPLGLSTEFHFSSPDLWQWERQRVRVAFDPLANPATATIACLDKHEVLCEAVCVDPFSGGDASSAIATARALRQLMRREYRVLLPDRETGAQRVHVAETELRTSERAVEIRRGGSPEEGSRKDAKTPNEEITLSASPRPRVSESSEPVPRASRSDLSSSLRRRAANLQQHEQIF